MQVERGQHRAELVGLFHEERQDLAAQRLIDVTDPRPSHRHRSRHQRHLAGLAVAIAIAEGVDGPARGFLAAEQLGDLLLQHRLDEALHLLADKPFQRFPFRPRRRGALDPMLFHGDVTFPTGRQSGVPV